MPLPPGPRAPAPWQTIGWMLRPAAFLQRVYARYGDPATIRTYWADEPMVLFSTPEDDAEDDLEREVLHSVERDDAAAPRPHLGASAGSSLKISRTASGVENSTIGSSAQ